MTSTNPYRKLEGVALLDCNRDAQRAYARLLERIRRSNQVPVRRNIATPREEVAIRFGQMRLKGALLRHDALVQRPK
jgi:hypothetical protein